MASYEKVLELTGHWSAIATAGVAFIAYCQFRFREISKKWKLERYLRKEKKNGEDRGQRTLIHLVAKLGLTEVELLQASFRSAKIERRVNADDNTGYATSILLEYKG